MRCPACKTTLVVVEREGIEIDWCLACRGLWFDEGELELLGEKAGRSLQVADLGADHDGSQTRSRRRCPRCPRRMEQISFELGNGELVEIDRCPDHGFWLDRGELGRIMSATEPDPDTDGGLVLEFLGETFAEDTARPPASDGRRQ